MEDKEVETMDKDTGGVGKSAADLDDDDIGIVVDDGGTSDIDLVYQAFPVLLLFAIWGRIKRLFYRTAHKELLDGEQEATAVAPRKKMRIRR